MLTGDIMFLVDIAADPIELRRREIAHAAWSRSGE